MKKHKLTEEQIRLIKTVVDEFDEEDKTARERQLRVWRKLKLLWEGFQQTWWSDTAHDWRVWDEVSGDFDQAFYDKKVNVFRAYLESIIAALSVTVPPIKCYPDDADNTLDLSTARAGDKIAELIYRHNNVPLVWIHGLFIYCTEGTVAAYNYAKAKKEYGEYIEEKYADDVETRDVTECPHCKGVLDEKVLTPEEAEIPLPDPNEVPFDPNTMAPMGQPETGQPMVDPNMVDPMALPDNPNMMGQPDMMNQGMDMSGLDNPYEEELAPQMGDEFAGSELEPCPMCGGLMVPTTSRKKINVTRLVDQKSHAKSRIMLECYGGLNVKVPNYARTQDDCPYLMFFYETHYANAIEKFKHLRDTDLVEKLKKNPAGPDSPYEQWSRLSPQYYGEYPTNNVTIKQIWLRPSAFNVLEEEGAEELLELFPEGCKVCYVNDEFGEAIPEALDDHWTLTYNPLADHIHHEPLGLLLVSIQEITSDLISLALQTIEHGVGQTFADPRVLDFNAYKQTETIPGGIYPAKPQAGKTLQEAFFPLKTASLSPEVMPFSQNIQQFGQLVSGALPSLFGGQLEGSETASEYSMSKAQALQRLQNTWKVFGFWWKTVFSKAIPMYIKEIQEDEKDVKRLEDGSFVNSFIRKAELEGKIGKVELEANENLPLTWSQRKDIIMQLLLSPNPELIKIIMSPDNLDIIKEAIGLNNIDVPGEDDRDAEHEEIKLLLNSEPVQLPQDPMMIQEAAMMGMEPLPPEEETSLHIEPEIDNHLVRFEVIRTWLVSEAGRQAKIDNPKGFKNVLLHAKEHLMALSPLLGTGPTDEPGAPSAEKPKQPSKKNAPITGESDVQTVQ